jgi:hypothetical protein
MAYFKILLQHLHGIRKTTKLQSGHSVLKIWFPQTTLWSNGIYLAVNNLRELTVRMNDVESNNPHADIFVEEIYENLEYEGESQPIQCLCDIHTASVPKNQMPAIFPT